MTREFYHVGGCLLADDPSYIKRKADQELIEGLKKREFCYVLNSRQMGKSSLRVRTMKQLEAEGVSCISIDLLSIIDNNTTEYQWYGSLICELANKLDIFDGFNPNQWWGERFIQTPLHCFNEFIDNVLLKKTTKPIVVFIDEVDCILGLEFKDAFFAFLRSLNDKRAENFDYCRLTFALLGVATPADLIQDRIHSRFDIGRPIDLQGFQITEVQPLIQGLTGQVDDPTTVLQEILKWTGGQPFLTQKLCQIFKKNFSTLPAGQEADTVSELVRTSIIDNWEVNDVPQHLRTIRDRFQSERSEKKVIFWLNLYRKILQDGFINADSSFEQTELRLSGLVVQREGKLRAYNRIYENVFNLQWVEEELRKQRPYFQKIDAWLASGYHDRSQLLDEREMLAVLKWAKDKPLPEEDHRFISESQTSMRDKSQQALAKNQKRARWISYITIFLFFLVIFFSSALFRTIKEEQSQQAALDKLKKKSDETQSNLDNLNSKYKFVNKEVEEVTEKLNLANNERLRRKRTEYHFATSHTLRGSASLNSAHSDCCASCAPRGGELTRSD